jgi:putative SOS response-associated peptidase YedK
MCVDIGYKSMLGPDGLPRYIKGIKIDRCLVEGDRDAPHLQAHTRPLCVVIQSDINQTPVVNKMSWGLVADFMVNNPELFKKYGNQLFNARAEKILQTGTTWNSLLMNRCLLVADGVYEHQEVRGRKNKLPYYIQLRSKEPLLIPGLFNPKTNSFAILTRGGNELFLQIHNSGLNKHRMPLLLPPAIAPNWIQEKLSNKEIERLLSFELPAGELSAYTVFSIRGHRLRPDGKKENDFFNWEAISKGDQASLF